MEQTRLPPIRISPDGRVTAGVFVLQPSHRHFRKRRAHWRVLLAGRAVTGWWLTPALALAAAERATIGTHLTN